MQRRRKTMKKKQKRLKDHEEALRFKVSQRKMYYQEHSAVFVAITVLVEVFLIIFVEVDVARSVIPTEGWLVTVEVSMTVLVKAGRMEALFTIVTVALINVSIYGLVNIFMKVQYPAFSFSILLQTR